MGRRFAIAVTVLDILLASVPTWMTTPPEVEAAEEGGAAGGEEMKEGVFATVVTGPGISPENVLRAKELRDLRELRGEVEVVEAAVEDLYATDVTGWDILPGSVLRETVATRSRADVAVEEEEEGVEVEIMEVVVDPSVISATDSAISPANVAKKRTAATSAMALGTLPGTVARMRTPATTAMRLDIS